MEKDTNTNNVTTGEKVINSHADVPDINDYLHLITQNHLQQVQNKIEAVFKTLRNKIEDNTSLIIAKEAEKVENENEFSNLKRVYSYEDDLINKNSTSKFNFIFDCLGFLHRTSDVNLEEEQVTNQIHNIKQLEKEQFKHLINLINDKGVVVFLMDYHHLIQAGEALKEVIAELNLNFLIKIYIVEKIPLVGMLYIQKFEKSQCNYENLKLLSYEVYDDNTVTKPIAYLVKDIPRSLAYMNEMYQYQGYLQEQRPGLIMRINVKENFWSDNIDFNITIIDTEDKDLLEKKKVAAIIVTKSYANDFIYLTKEGNMQLCDQVKASRLILIKPNSFNNDSIQIIKDKISHYVLLFKFRECVDDAIPIMLFSDSRNEMYELYKDNNLVIRDMIETENKETYRQLIFHSSPQEIQSEIKLILTNKTKAKSDPETYTTLPTIDRYKEKNLVSCLDKNVICSFYIKCLLTGIFFISSDNFPTRKFEICVLGAGIGSVNYYFDRTFLGKINIESVELHRQMPELGDKYFGFKNLEKENYNWTFSDAKEYLLKNAEKNLNRFDMIVSDINNTDHTEGISPPPVFFQTEVLTAIKDSLNETGVYIINLMARSYNNYNEALNKLDSIFANIFIVENTEDLNKIHFCFKNKISNEEYKRIYLTNLENYQLHADLSLVQEDYKKILNKIVDLNDLKNPPELNKKE